MNQSIPLGAQEVGRLLRPAFQGFAALLLALDAGVQFRRTASGTGGAGWGAEYRLNLHSLFLNRSPRLKWPKRVNPTRPWPSRKLPLPQKRFPSNLLSQWRPNRILPQSPKPRR